MSEMSIGGENYERSIIPIRSDISIFSRGTVGFSTCKECAMNIGEPLRTIIVEPLELPVNAPTVEPKPEPEPQQPQPEHEPASV